MTTEVKNAFGETEAEAKAFRELTFEITEKLKNLTYNKAKLALRYVKYDLKNALILS